MPPAPLPAPPHLTHFVPKPGRERRVELFWGQNAICAEAHAQACALHWGGGGRGTREGPGRSHLGGLARRGEASPPGPRRPRRPC